MNFPWAWYVSRIMIYRLMNQAYFIHQSLITTLLPPYAVLSWIPGQMIHKTLCSRLLVTHKFAHMDFFAEFVRSSSQCPYSSHAGGLDLLFMSLIHTETLIHWLMRPEHCSLHEFWNVHEPHEFWRVYWLPLKHLHGVCKSICFMWLGDVKWWWSILFMLDST